jgi:hypothetical protein
MMSAHDEHDAASAEPPVVWLVQHVLSCDHVEEIKIIGIYATEAAARSAIEVIATQPGFRDTHDGFHVDRYPLNRTAWADGFVRIAGM